VATTERELKGEEGIDGGRRRGSVRTRTLRRSTERRPLRMHSLSPVPSTITSYSTSMAGGRRRRSIEKRWRKGGREESVDLQRLESRSSKRKRFGGSKAPRKGSRAAEGGSPRGVGGGYSSPSVSR